MLEKMGWSKGKGLGAQEQGSTEHIKVRVKNNTLGLGASISHEDNWIAHQDDFNQLLADLNDCHGQDGPEATTTEEKKFSLEEKSKTSRKRVHYVKFAKGKDLSSRSEDDLSCIFGKRPVKKAQVAAAAAGTDSSEEGPREESDPPDSVNLSNTVTSTLSVQEYFARRMAKLKKAQLGLSGTSADSPPTKAESPERSGPQSKKKKRRLEREGGIPGSRDEASGREDADEPDAPKKGRRRRKAEQPGDGGPPLCNGSPDGTQENRSCFPGTAEEGKGDPEEPRPKKKNKRKHKNVDWDAAEELKSTKPKKQKLSS
uniref:G-patch domain-containing protein n=2 Tax=Varanus komodoensis TaxID=61221 RepID=A0A8D2IRK9_VARKO